MGEVLVDMDTWKNVLVVMGLLAIFAGLVVLVVVSF